MDIKQYRFTIFILVFLSFLLTACAAPSPTPTAVPPTITPAPSSTPVPSTTATLIPTATVTATPEPYLLEDGTLLDWDEAAEDYQVVGEGIAYVTKTTEGQVVAKDSNDRTRFSYDGEEWKEVEKADPNYGYIAPAVWGEESLPLVKQWWEGYKENMPTNEDIKWMTYEDGSRVEMGEIPGLDYASTRTFGVIIGEMFDFPNNIDPNDYEKMLLTFLPTNPDKVEEAGNIVPVRLTTDLDKSNWMVGLRVIPENGAVRGSRLWNAGDVAKSVSHGELIDFIKLGLSGENPPLYGCQLAVSLAGSGSELYSEVEHVRAMYGEEGDGEWKVDNDLDWLALNPQNAGLFVIPESCMTEELWEAFNALK